MNEWWRELYTSASLYGKRRERRAKVIDLTGCKSWMKETFV
jgi:hypothetical protein